MLGGAGAEGQNRHPNTRVNPHGPFPAWMRNFRAKMRNLRAVRRNDDVVLQYEADVGVKGAASVPHMPRCTARHGIR